MSPLRDQRVNADDEPVRFQFSLRTILVATAICALLLGLGPSLGVWALSFWNVTYTICVSLLIAIGAYTLGWLSSRHMRLHQVSVLRIAGQVLLVICTFLTCYAFWWRYRWTWGTFDDPAWPRPWPYPDTLLSAFHDWLDARNPPPPGYFKIHGEAYAVLRLLNLVYFGSLAATVGALGMLTPRLPGTIWESRPVRFLRAKMACILSRAIS